MNALLGLKKMVNGMLPLWLPPTTGVPTTIASNGAMPNDSSFAGCRKTEAILNFVNNALCESEPQKVTPFAIRLASANR